MNNKSLATMLALSTLILPAVSSARLTNEIIRHEGILSVPGASSIKLEQHAGRAINLNKGMMEIRTTKVPMGFSLLDPQLVLKQNGQTLTIDIPTDKYSDEETFTVLGKDSNLNYDLYLRKMITSSKAVSAVVTQICTYQKFGMTCGVDVNGAYNCVSGMKDIAGTQLAKNTTVDVTTTYKLTLGQKNVAKAEFTSSKIKTVLKSSEEQSQCK